MGIDKCSCVFCMARPAGREKDKCIKINIGIYIINEKMFKLLIYNGVFDKG